MKFKFKIQQYQTDAVERTVEVFEGQPSTDSLAYCCDLGKHTSTLYDDELEMGYRNSEIQFSPKRYSQTSVRHRQQEISSYPIRLCQA